jgi:hypothetical protein
LIYIYIYIVIVSRENRERERERERGLGVEKIIDEQAMVRYVPVRRLGSGFEG